jgi:hypothetical protein
MMEGDNAMVDQSGYSQFQVLFKKKHVCHVCHSHSQKSPMFIAKPQHQLPVAGGRC